MRSQTRHTRLLRIVTLTALLGACGSASTEGTSNGDGQGAGASGSGGTSNGGTGSGTDGGTSAIPLGLYECASSESGAFINIGGLTGTMLLNGSGTELTATYAVGDATPEVSFTFAVTSETSATLAPAGQPFLGAWVSCGGGVASNGGIADPVPGTATLNVTGGELTYNASTLFMTVVGHSLSDIQSGCLAPSGSLTITESFSCTKVGAP